MLPSDEVPKGCGHPIPEQKIHTAGCGNPPECSGIKVPGCGPPPEGKRPSILITPAPEPKLDIPGCGPSGPKIELAPCINTSPKEDQKTQLYHAKSDESSKGNIKVPVKENNKQVTENEVEWTNHGFKHFPQKNILWKDVVESTKNGPAKYIPGVDIESLEREAWKNGIPVSNGKPWKVGEYDFIVGAKKGIETKYIRVEKSANTIHGHPITPSEYKKLKG